LKPVDQRAGGPPCELRFRFEDYNGTLIGGNYKRQINPDQGAPQVKRVLFPLDNNEGAAAGPSSSLINTHVEVSRTRIPKSIPSGSNNRDVYQLIS